MDTTVDGADKILQLGIRALRDRVQEFGWDGPKVGFAIPWGTISSEPEPRLCTSDSFMKDFHFYNFFSTFFYFFLTLTLTCI